MTAVRARLYRDGAEVDTWVHAALPADPAAVNVLVRRQRDRAIGTAKPSRFRCDVHDEATGEFLYQLEEAP